MLSSESKRFLARHLASCVLPTPVGPKNRKVPMGRPGSLSPARLRRMARTTVSTASSCPITSLRRRSFMAMRRCPSLSATLLTGMPVMRDTTHAMSSASTMFSLLRLWAILSRTMEPASSITSMALSGSARSVMYRSVCFTQASSASEEYLTLWKLS